MVYVGIDLHRKRSSVAVIDQGGASARGGRFASRTTRVFR